MLTITADNTGLQTRLGELAAVAHSDMGEVARVEAGQVAWRIAQAIGPGSLAEGAAKAKKDMRGYLATAGAVNIGKKHQGAGDVAWLYAGPTYLAGVERKNDWRDQSADTVLAMYYEAKKHTKTNAWREVGRRGKQRVSIQDRLLISKGAFSTILNSIKANIGQAKASFAFTAMMTTHKRIPAWISRHFATEVSSKAIYVDSTKSPNPHVEFGSRAKGVESNDRLRGKIMGTFAASAEIIRLKVEKILNGYAYDLRTGGVFKPKADQIDRN